MPRVKHVVLMKLRGTTSAARIRDIYADLEKLRRKMPGLLDVSGGPQASHEGLGQGFTHGFAITFADVAARDAYLADDDHEVVKNKILAELDGGLAGVVAFDWLDE